MFEAQLKELGLTENEVRIYLVLLQQGDRNPAQVAEALGLHRGYVYDTLERMHEKEIVSIVLAAGKKQYRATAPQTLAKLLEDRARQFAAIVPKLQALRLSEKSDTKAELHQGKKAVRALLKDAGSHGNGEMISIGVDEEKLLAAEPIYMEQYFNALKERKIRERVIIKKGAKMIKHPNVQYREVDPSFIGNVMQFIYGHKVALFIDGTPNNLIIIENKIVADTYRAQFELLWNSAQRPLKNSI